MNNLNHGRKNFMPTHYVKEQGGVYIPWQPYNWGSVSLADIDKIDNERKAAEVSGEHYDYQARRINHIYVYALFVIEGDPTVANAKFRTLHCWDIINGWS